jgi:hypothetical protein
LLESEISLPSFIGWIRSSGLLPYPKGVSDFEIPKYANESDFEIPKQSQESDFEIRKCSPESDSAARICHRCGLFREFK